MCTYVCVCHLVFFGRPQRSGCPVYPGHFTTLSISIIIIYEQYPEETFTTKFRTTVHIYDRCWLNLKSDKSPGPRVSNILFLHTVMDCFQPSLSLFQFPISN